MKTPMGFTGAAAVLPFPAPAWDSWCRYGKIRRVPAAVIQVLGTTFCGFIEIWSLGGISAVASDGIVRVFVPDALLWPARCGADQLSALGAWISAGAGHVAEPLSLQDISGNLFRTGHTGHKRP